MGLSDDDLENLNGEMGDMMSGLEGLLNPGEKDEDGEDDEQDSQTATFPFLNKLFGNAANNENAENLPARDERTEQKPRGDKPNGQKKQKHKFLDLYCQNLTQKARDGKLDRIVGRDVETERVIQDVYKRQPSLHFLLLRSSSSVIVRFSARKHNRDVYKRQPVCKAGSC